MRNADWANTEWRRIGLRKGRRNKRIDAQEMEILVEKLRVERPSKPYGWTIIQSHLVKAIEEFFGFTLTSTALQTLKTYITKETRKQAGEQLYEPKPPAYFEWQKMKKIWDMLWLPSPKGPMETRHKVTCVSYICYVTGARAKEVCEIMIEDLEEKTEGSDTFLRMPIRVSKSNSKKTRRESLILISRQTDIMPIMKRLKLSIGNRKKAHGMRLGYVLNSSIGGVEDDAIINSCRWKDGTMLRYYRNHFLENTKHGSAYKISKKTEEMRLNDIDTQKRTAEVAIQTESTEPPKKKTQSVLRVIKKMQSKATQTETRRKVRPETPVKIVVSSDDEFEGGIFNTLLSMRTRGYLDLIVQDYTKNENRSATIPNLLSQTKNQTSRTVCHIMVLEFQKNLFCLRRKDINECGTIACGVKLVTAADGCNISEQQWKRMNLQCSMLMQPMSMFIASRTLRKMSEARTKFIDEAVEGAYENLHYEIHNLKALHDNARSSTKLRSELRAWNMVQENIVTKLIRLDASVNTSLTEVNKILTERLEKDGPEKELDNLAELEQKIKDLAIQNEMRGRFSVIYLVKQDDEMPLVVLHKHNNFTIVEPTTEEWKFHTNVDVKTENKKIETMLSHLSEDLRTFTASQKALVVSVSGEEFLNRQARMTKRRFTRITPRMKSSENKKANLEKE
ncbi:unnamed protein product [Oikopleura dioica]|uniref:Uncharacterized protein n=1 Tax=Oikopleura dioica TaxID=34765 RepID=E4WQG0_OIKDI|nr:unnamed protein product [Oikopleura dioica]